MNLAKHGITGLAVSVLALAMGLGAAGNASAGAGTTFCGYQAVGGTQQWVRSYVGRRQCPASDVNNGVQGILVSSEYIA